MEREEVVEQGNRQLEREVVEQSRHKEDGREAESVLKEVDRDSIDGFNLISLDIKLIGDQI